MHIQAGMIGKCPVYTVQMSANEPPSDFPQVKRLLLDLADTSKPAVFDIAAVNFVDSTGIGALIGLARAFDERGGCLILCGMHPRMWEIFSAVRLDRMMPFRESSVVAATELDRTPKPQMSVLLKKNPTAGEAKVRWEERQRLESKREVQATTNAETQESTYARDNPQDAAVVKSRIVPKLVDSSMASTPLAQNHAAPAPGRNSDWEELLVLFARTREIAKRNGVAFSTDSNYGKLLSDVANALADKMPRGGE